MYICFPVLVYADSFSFTLPVSSLIADQEMTLTASVSGFQHGKEFYIKGAFYKQGSSNYFGYTKSDDSWIKNSVTTKNQKKVTVGTWNHELLVRPDFQDSGFIGDGEYFFKVGYYSIDTEGNPSSVKWSDTSVAIHLTAPTPTPLPTETPRPTQTPKPASTATPTVRSIPPSLSPSRTPTSLPTVTTKVPTQSDRSIVSSILGTQRSSSESSYEEEHNDIQLTIQDTITSSSSLTLNSVEGTSSSQQDNPLILSFILIGSGIAVLAVVSIVSKIWGKKET
jgi:hypothetical protein